MSKGKKKPAAQPGPAANLVHGSLVKTGTVHGGPNSSVRFNMEGRCVYSRACKTASAARSCHSPTTLLQMGGGLTLGSGCKSDICPPIQPSKCNTVTSVDLRRYASGAYTNRSNAYPSTLFSNRLYFAALV
eukprot:COSAG03_NODE_1599_length_3807_cov_7.276699_3_plen_131_part_00